MEKKLTFEEIRKNIIDLCFRKNACGSNTTPYSMEFEKLFNSKNEEDFWKVIVDNGNWCYKKGILAAELFNKYDNDILAKHGLYYQGEHIISQGINYVWGNAVINDVWGNAVINYVGENAVIKNVRGNAVINYVWGNAVIC
jgi:hypothetical protein